MALTAAALVLLTMAFVGCGGGEALPRGGAVPTSAATDTETVVVFAAASLQEAFRDIAKAFREAYPQYKVRLNFDGSQRLSLQLKHGAAADVFASADWAQLEPLMETGLLDHEPDSFASNGLVFLVSPELWKEPLSDPTPDALTPKERFRTASGRLAAPGTKIVVGSEEAPIGAYSNELLDRMAEHPDLGQHYSDGIRANIVSRETSVRSVVQKVALGEADAGIAYRTDALPGRTSQATVVVEVPDSMNVVARYPIAALNDSEAARAFVNFVLSERGRNLLASRGFGPG